MIHCVICGFKSRDHDAFDNHKCLELTPLEHKLITVAHIVGFCDHYCCGMTPERCMATNLPRYLEEVGLKIVEIEGSDV